MRRTSPFLVRMVTSDSGRQTVESVGRCGSRARRRPTGRATSAPHPSPTYEHGVNAMTWETPAATDYRFGFEITMYMYHR